jgi:hypothetical protein
MNMMQKKIIIIIIIKLTQARPVQYELHELMNARHREDIDELEKLEQAYEASLKDKVAKSEKRFL